MIGHSKTQSTVLAFIIIKGIQESYNAIIIYNVPPSTYLLSESLLLLFVNGKGCTGHRELDDEDDEQNNHVEEQQHLLGVIKSVSDTELVSIV